MFNPNGQQIKHNRTRTERIPHQIEQEKRKRKKISKEIQEQNYFCSTNRIGSCTYRISKSVTFYSKVNFINSIEFSDSANVCTVNYTQYQFANR